MDQKCKRKAFYYSDLALKGMRELVKENGMDAYVRLLGVEGGYLNPSQSVVVHLSKSSTMGIMLFAFGPDDNTRIDFALTYMGRNIPAKSHGSKGKLFLIPRGPGGTFDLRVSSPTGGCFGVIALSME